MSELYNARDLETFKSHIGDVIQKIGDIVSENYAPTKKEIAEVQKIILQYAKDKKRKMYGGYGLHIAIKNKDPSGSFYKDDELSSKDLDLYSPEPIADLVELCDLLHGKGFKNVFAREALHSETYTLEVNKHTYCDFSYVPRNVYNKIPFILVNGYTIPYPYFLEIDYLKMFIDPILSNYRWEKSFERFYLLQKYYPIKHSNKVITFDHSIPKKIYDLIGKFITNNKTIALTGSYAYNIYLNVSKINKSYIKDIKIPFFEMITTDYENDVNKIVDLISDKEKVRIIEYYPFFTLTEFHTDILYDNKVIARVYNNLHNLCFSYVKHDGVNMGTFHFNLRMCLVNAMYERVNDKKDMEQVYYDMASHLIQMRKEYLSEKDRTMFSKTIFGDFIYDCMGVTQNDKIYHDELFKTKKRVVFRYKPAETKIDPKKWNFANSSGNQVHNSKNFKIKFTDFDYHTNTEEPKEEEHVEGEIQRLEINDTNSDDDDL